ncbi:SMP-30/gluconolactonase/LRE family protein [Microbacterium halophytorum]|uniref:SMP-30/gluconolactonase/LRE family protein n=1 Tax=Microbacterium halophytorum TaxID=2067568 RepID=UPI001E625136|nr:SMP-30/gluconolactonase/LRE family protein [Microbacterium halophytorum]
MRRALAAGAVLAAVPLALAACASAEEDAAGAPSTEVAVELSQVTEPHDATGGTLLEGPTFSEESELFVVDVMAPPGDAKVLRIDTTDGSSEPVYSDDASAFTSAQFGDDGRLYLTDIVGGSIQSITTEGDDPRTVFEGDVDGRRMQPDDLAFGGDGAMYVSDTSGMGGTDGDIGRVVRVDAEGSASVIADQLPSPNGISFDEDMAGLWVAQYNANRVDYLALSEDGKSLAELHTAFHVDGGTTRVDSTAVDADGNVYQAFHGRTAIEVFAADGARLTTIDVPDDEHELSSATNIAIEPGTTDGYITVSGADGGFIYTFDALAEGTRQSNGG